MTDGCKHTNKSLQERKKKKREKRNRRKEEKKTYRVMLNFVLTKCVSTCYKVMVDCVKKSIINNLLKCPPE